MDLARDDAVMARRKMKARAPPPPSQPLPHRTPRSSDWLSAGSDSKENQRYLQICLPSGHKTTVSVDGRKALMDLLVDLCSQYHLNPTFHTLELLSSDAQPVIFKPNALLASLDVSCALIKERAVEKRVVQKPPTRMPEKSVRLVVNHHRGQKAVVRVNPATPLHLLLPLICHKCECDPARARLFQDVFSHQELDLKKSLNDLEIKELYVLDQRTDTLSLTSQSLRETEKKSLLSFLKFSRRKSKGLSDITRGPFAETRPSTLGQSQSVMNISKLSPNLDLKKRRAPAPPSASLQSLALESQMTLSSSDSHRSKKRPAPAPPPGPCTPIPVPNASAQCPSVPVPSDPSTAAPRDSSSSSSSGLNHSSEDSDPSRCVYSSSSSSEDVVLASSSSCSLDQEPEPEPPRENESQLESELEETLTELRELCLKSETSDLEETGNTSNSETAVAQTDEGAWRAGRGHDAHSEARRRLGDDEHSCQPIKKQNCCEDDKSTRHLTRNGNLPDSNSSIGAFIHTEDRIPVSVVDMDIPVTTIDDVTDLDSCLTEDQHCPSSNQNKTSPTFPPEDPDAFASSIIGSAMIQTTNPSHVNENQSCNQQKRAVEEKVIFNASDGESEELKMGKDKSRTDENGQMTVEKFPDERFKSKSATRSCNRDNSIEIRAASQSLSKVTQSSVSRFGMKTFTVIPPKPNVSQNRPVGSLVTGAIKIDDLGNMVERKKIAYDRVDDGMFGDVNANESRLDKAKVFWSIADKQDRVIPNNKRLPMKNKEADIVLVSSDSTVPPKSHLETLPKELDILEKNSPAVVASKPLVVPGHSSVTVDKCDFTVLTPSRRTSSHYLASAIAKKNSFFKHKADLTQAPLETVDAVSKPPRSPKHHRRPEIPAGSSRINVLEKRTLFEDNEPKSPKSKTHEQFAQNGVHERTSEVPSERVNNVLERFTSEQKQTSHVDVYYAKKTELQSSDVPSEATFGPVKKFKPVQLRSVQKDVSLHSLLMEAIQSGEGIDRLRKVTDASRCGPVKKPSYSDAGNERAALLSAIRASGNSTRLKQSQSKASKELERLKNSDTNRGVPVSIMAPPPAPPPLAKQPVVISSYGGNAEAAREALLEAIRSGSGAQALRKVPVAQTRRLVNGRLGTFGSAAPLPHGR